MHKLPFKEAKQPDMNRCTTWHTLIATVKSTATLTNLTLKICTTLAFKKLTTVNTRGSYITLYCKALQEVYLIGSEPCSRLQPFFMKKLRSTALQQQLCNISEGEAKREAALVVCGT